MYLYTDIFRMSFYALGIFLVVIGELPWWIPLGVVLYDNHWGKVFKVPFTKTPKMDLQDLLKVRAGMTQGTDRPQ